MLFGIKFYVLLTFFISWSNAMQIMFHSSQLIFNPTHMQHLQININPDKFSLNVSLNFVQDHVSPVWLNINVAVKNRRNNHYRILYSSRPINICVSLKSTNHLFFKSYVNKFLGRGGLSKQCPFEKGNYTWSDVSAKNLNLPPFLKGTYMSIVYGYFKSGQRKDMLTNISVVWEVL